MVVIVVMMTHSLGVKFSVIGGRANGGGLGIVYSGAGGGRCLVSGKGGLCFSGRSRWFLAWRGVHLTIIVCTATSV